MDSFRKYFSKVIKAHFPKDAPRLLVAMEKHFVQMSGDVAFATTSINPMDRRLVVSAYFLAMVKTLDIRGEGFDTIRKLCLEVVTDYVRPKNAFHTMLKRLPPKLLNTYAGTLMLRWFAKKVGAKGDQDGFVAKVITDKAETYGLGYGFDIVECGICKLFNKHNYNKYASVLCEVDEMTSAMAGLELIRTGTIARGGTKCDFRFRKKIA